MSDINTVTVTLLDKDYQVSCPAEQVDSLTTAARYLNGKMADIRGSGKVVGLDRIAVMAALNIANEYLNGKHALDHTQTVFGERLASLNDKVGEALAKHKQLDL